MSPLVWCSLMSSVLELLNLSQSVPNFTQVLDKRLFCTQNITNIPLAGLELRDLPAF